MDVANLGSSEGIDGEAMSARDLRGQYATGDHWDRQRAREAELLQKARRHAIVRTHAPYVERPDQGGRVVAL